MATLKYDPQADGLYVYLRAGAYHHGRDLGQSRRVDYDADGQPIGVEILDVSQGITLEGLPEIETIAPLLAPFRIEPAAKTEG